jgi:hypothetical protein
VRVAGSNPVVRSTKARPGASHLVNTPEEAHRLRGLDEPIIATLTTDDRRTIEVAASRRDRAKLLAPFHVDVDVAGSGSAAG